MGLWLLILVLLGSAIYLNRVGLPNFVKKPLLEKLRARGLDLQFSRLRLRWYQGMVAENVRFGRSDDPLSPYLTVGEVKVALDYKALARLRFQVESLGLRQGRLVCPVAETNGSPRQLTVDAIQTQLRLLPADEWALDQFTAHFAGAKIQLSGSLTNASFVREWKLFSATQPAPPGALQSRLRQLEETLARIRFAASPNIKLNVQGDARDLQSFNIRLGVTAPGADTPWGTFDQARFAAHLFPASTNHPSHAELNLEALGARSSWGATNWAAITNLHFHLRVASFAQRTNFVNAELTLSADKFQTQWANGSNLVADAQWTHALTNPVPLSGRGRLECQGPQTSFGEGASAATLRLSGELSPNESPLPAPDASWSWWAKLQPYALDWQSTVTSVQSPKLTAELLEARGRWRAPQLEMTRLHARLYQAQMDAQVNLDVASRAFHAELTSDVDPHQLSPWLTEGGQRWLAQYSWRKPPRVAAQAWLVLPAWTNRHPDWHVEVQPSLRLEGSFQIEQGGAYRGVTVDTAQSHFSYSNMVWRLPDLAVTRPEGRLNAVHHADDRTKDFYWRLQSSIDVRALRPLLQTNQQRDFDLIGFTQPPHLTAEIWGRFHDDERIGLVGQVALTNFTFRGETVSGFQTALLYSNRFLLLTNAHLQRQTQRIGAESLGVDFSSEKIYLAGGFSTVEPQVIARAIGPKIAKTVEPYHFQHPPTARVHGIIPIRDEADADLHFDLDGGPFQWFKFTLPHITGHVHWAGQRLMLENLRADFYGGAAAGTATFDFLPEHDADFQFNLNVTNALLQFLIADLSTKSNQLEGALSGSLIVNKANSGNWRTWQGGGNAMLRDGLIWDIPIFGIFSPILNSLAPGLGNSRASDASGTFTIRNGVIHSDDLEVRSPAMRLAYRGSVDLQGQINARVEAELLRDVWLLGPLVSTVFSPLTKLFEYKVTGSLDQPKTDQVFLAKMVLLPFHPFRTLKGLLPEESGTTRSNAPPPVPGK